MNEERKANIAKLVVDLMRNTVADKYSQADAVQGLRDALKDANGGSYIVDWRHMRDHRSEVFSIIEVIVPLIKHEGLVGNEFFTNLVEERNISLGDSEEFVVEANSTLVVSRIADGIAQARRQRIGEKSTLTIPTFWNAVTVYEEFSRFMAGKVDWNDLCNKVGKAFKQDALNQCLTLLIGITDATPGLNSNYVKGGSYNEEAVLEIVEHVEADTGKSATIYGTKAALRKCTTADASSDLAKNDRYNLGYYGKLASVPMVAIANRHKVGTDTFVFNNNDLYIFASDDRPIKYVHEGVGIIDENTIGTTADRSITYSFFEKEGFGLVVNGKLGRYTISS